MRTKYVQIERSDGYKRAYTTLRAAEDMVKSGEASGFKPVTLKAIKDECLVHFREKDYFRHKAEDEFVAKYDKKRFKAKVVDGGPRCEMLVQIIGAEELHLQPLYACNIQGKKTWYPETACVYYKTGQVIDVELKVFHGFTLFVCGLTPGHFDRAHWERLDQSKLAFKCDENGKALNGLFGGTK